MNNQSFHSINTSFQNKHFPQYNLTSQKNGKRNLKLKLFQHKKQLFANSKDPSNSKPLILDKNLITKQFNFKHPSKPKPISRNDSLIRSTTPIPKKHQKETINCENLKHLSHSNTKSYTPPPQQLLKNQFISKSTLDTEVSNNSTSFKINQEKHFKLVLSLKRQIKFQNEKLNEKDKEIEELKKKENQINEYNSLKLENEILHDELEKVKCELLERNQNEENGSEKINDDLISALKKELNSIKANIFVINEKYQSEVIKNEQLTLTNQTLMQSKKELETLMEEVESYKDKINKLEHENFLLKQMNDELKMKSQNELTFPDNIILITDKDKSNLLKILQMIYYEHDKQTQLNEFIKNYFIEKSYNNYINNFCKCFGISDKCLIGRWIYYNKQIKNDKFIEDIKSDDYENANDTEIIVDTIKRKNQKLKNVYLSCELIDLTRSGYINYELFNIITKRYLNQSESNNLIKCIIKHTNYDESQNSVFDIKYSVLQKWITFEDEDDNEEQYEEIEEEKEDNEDNIICEEIYENILQYTLKNRLTIEELLKVFPLKQKNIPINVISTYLYLLGIVDRSVKIKYDVNCLDEKGNLINKDLFIHLYHQNTSVDYKKIKEEEYIMNQVNGMIDEIFRKTKESENLTEEIL